MRRVTWRGHLALLGLDLVLWAGGEGPLARLGWWLYHRTSAEFFEGVR